MDTKEAREKIMKLQGEKQYGDKIQLFFDQKMDTSKFRLQRDLYGRQREKITDTMTVGTFFIGTRGGSLCWSARTRRCRTGLEVPYEVLAHMVDAKILKPNYSKGFVNFLNKFDPRFATVKFIQGLYEECCFDYNDKTKESNWHTRFRPINSTGKRVMDRFLERFTNIYQSDKVRESHDTDRHSGRDITISFEGGDRVYYSSEFMNCANGSYYFVATPSTIFWYEDD